MTIAEVSRAYGISADTLRYYERIGLIPPVPRTKGGVRNYGEESCGWIQLMKCMRAAGVQIEALIEYVDLFRQGDATIGARKALLMEQRDQLVARMKEMQASLDLLNQKIDRYEQSMVSAERKLRLLHTEQTESWKKRQDTGHISRYLVFFRIMQRIPARVKSAGTSGRPGCLPGSGWSHLPGSSIHRRGSASAPPPAWWPGC